MSDEKSEESTQTSGSERKLGVASWIVLALLAGSLRSLRPDSRAIETLKNVVFAGERRYRVGLGGESVRAGRCRWSPGVSALSGRMGSVFARRRRLGPESIARARR